MFGLWNVLETFDMLWSVCFHQLVQGLINNSVIKIKINDLKMILGY